MTHRTPLAAAFLALCLPVSAFAGPKWVGEWEDGTVSTIEIVSPTIPFIVRYCHQFDCDNYEPDGDGQNMIFNFDEGENFPGAVLNLTLEGKIYRGWYKINGAPRDYKITMGPE